MIRMGKLQQGHLVSNCRYLPACSCALCRSDTSAVPYTMGMAEALDTSTPSVRGRTLNVVCHACTLPSDNNCLAARLHNLSFHLHVKPCQLDTHGVFQPCCGESACSNMQTSPCAGAQVTGNLSRARWPQLAPNTLICMQPRVHACVRVCLQPRA